MIILNIIYHISGLLGIAAILISSINLFMTTMILITNPRNILIRIVQIISIFYIMFIIFSNINILYSNLYKMAFIIPLSINKMTFLDDIIEGEKLSKCYLGNVYTHRFYFNDYNEIQDFLNNLDNGKSYLITLEFILSWLIHDENSPVIILSKPILVSRDSNPWLISNFIKTRINLACNNYYLDENILDMMSDPEGPGINVKYSEIEIF